MAALARKLGAPVVTTITGKGVMAETDPQVFGVTGSMGSPKANEVVRQADLVFFIGCKAGQLATFGYDCPAYGVTTIHLDIDPEEIGRNFPGQHRPGGRRPFGPGRPADRPGWRQLRLSVGPGGPAPNRTGSGTTK